MQLNNYQQDALETAVYPGRHHTDGLVYAALGIASEAGEVAGKVKKILRDSNGVIETHDQALAILDEVGDVLWYAAAVTDELRFTLEYAAQRNLEKLRSRQERNVIGGSGDER